MSNDSLRELFEQRFAGATAQLQAHTLHRHNEEIKIMAAKVEVWEQAIEILNKNMGDASNRKTEALTPALYAESAVATSSTNDTLNDCTKEFEKHFGKRKEYSVKAEYDERLDGWKAAWQYLTQIKRCEIRLPSIEQIAECLVAADTDEHGIDDWKLYRHMAEAIAGLYERRIPKRESGSDV